MFRDATQRKRIGFGFAVMLSVLAIVVGTTGYLLGLARVLSVTEFHKNTNVIKERINGTVNKNKRRL